MNTRKIISIFLICIAIISIIFGIFTIFKDIIGLALIVIGIVLLWSSYLIIKRKETQLGEEAFRQSAGILIKK